MTYYLKNSSGQVTAQKTIAVKYDATAPNQPSLDDRGDATDTTVTLTATGSTDEGSGFKEYTLTEANGKISPQTSTNGTFELSGLTRNTEYSFTVTAKDNAGNISEASAPWTGTTKKTSLSEAAVTLTGVDNLMYTGVSQVPTVTVTLGGETVDADQYTVSYVNSNTAIVDGGTNDTTNAGAITVTVTANENGNFTDESAEEPTYDIHQINLFPDISVGADGAWDKVYDGTTDVLDSQKLSISLDGVLTADADAVSATAAAYAYNSAEVDEATSITATGITLSGAKASNYTLDYDAVEGWGFSITKVYLEDVYVVQNGTLTYNGDAQTATVSTEATAVNNQAVSFTYSTEENGTYEATVPAFTNAGEYEVYYQASAANHDTAYGSFTVTIDPKDIQETSISADEQTYNGQAQTPAVVKDGNTTLTAGLDKDYTVTYQNNTNAGQARYTVTGHGNYTGTASDEFTIAQQELTITAKAQTITYGGSIVSAVSQVETVGLQNGETLTGITLTPSTDQATTSGTITPSEAVMADANVDNYDITYYTGDLTVNAKPITVTANAASKTYGEDDPDLTYTVSAETPLVNDDTLEGALSRDEGEAVGQYNITLGTLANANYNITFTGAKFTIRSASLDEVRVEQSHSLTYNGEAQTAEVDATADTANGQTVSFTYSTEKEGTYEATVPAFTNAGTYTVYYKASADNHIAASGSFTVTIDPKAIQDISISFDDQTYNGKAQTPAVVTDGDKTLAEGADYTIEYKNNINAGQAAFTVTGIGNYTGSDGPNDFTIEQVKLSITANAKTITYGDAPANSGVTYDGFISGEDENNLTGTLAYDYDYTQFGDAGNYTITPKGLTSGNYDIVFEDGALTVDVKPINVTANANSKTYITDDPALTYTVSAETPLVNGDTLEGQLIRDKGEDVGQYDITLGTLANDNYSITFQGATFTINPATVTMLDLGSMISVPVKNDAPDTGLSEYQYTGTIAWNGASDLAKFLGGTVYTATVTLTPTSNYTFAGVAADAFEFDGASSITNATVGEDGNMVVTIVFPKTDDASVTTVAATGTPTKTTYNIGETLAPAGLTVTVTYDDGTTKTFNAETGFTGISFVPATMAADTTAVKLSYDDVESENITVTVRENLTSVTPPDAITDVSNGTAKTAEALDLPKTVAIVTSTGDTTTANVTWDLAATAYDPASLEATPAFTVNGTVALPTGMSNVDNVALTAQITVNVKAAELQEVPAQNTDPDSDDTPEVITGITTEQQVTLGDKMTISVREFVRGDNTYIPVAWQTNPSGGFSLRSGIVYDATVDTTGMSEGPHIFTVTYREVDTETRAATGKMVQTQIRYSTVKPKPPVSTENSTGNSAAGYTINAWVTAGGSISPSGIGTYAEGETPTFTITPAAGYRITKVTVDGVDVGAVGSYTFSALTRSHEIGAYFDKASAIGWVRNPATGDSTSVLPWVILLALAAVGLGSVLVLRRKKQH